MKISQFSFSIISLMMSSALFAMAPKPVEETPSKVAQEINNPPATIDENKVKTESNTPDGSLSSSVMLAMLEDNRWELIDAKKNDGTPLVGLEHLISQDTPNVELRFSNGRVNANYTCNQQMAGFSLAENNSITFGAVAQNMRACVNPNIAIRDDSVISILSTAQTPIIDRSNKQPLLTLRDANNTSFTFKGFITPEAYFDQEGTVLFFEVKPTSGSCSSNGQKANTCLYVREIQYDESYRKIIPNEAWQEIPAANIYNFSLEAGYYHTIRVRRFEFDKNSESSNVPFSGVSTAFPFYVLELVVEMSESGQQ
ncbi:META domain-containing protein [Thorsellia kenyensis]|uniref:META domain-containing protein n=1 Tax=Thorsellia kenyensis TaxID=1549888 RepID=A0ABV6C9X5_9GAMM